MHGVVDRADHLSTFGILKVIADAHLHDFLHVGNLKENALPAGKQAR